MRRVESALCVHVHVGVARAVPGGEENTALAALVLNVLGAAHQVGNAAEAEAEADAEGPGAVKRVSSRTVIDV